MELIDQWLEVVNQARQKFTFKKYQEWCFIVGIQGTLEERIELGKRAIEMLTPKSVTVMTNSFSLLLHREDSITNAVSPSSDYPMQRGVKKE